MTYPNERGLQKLSRSQERQPINYFPSGEDVHQGFIFAAGKTFTKGLPLASRLFLHMRICS